ncbi:F-box domain-containing protein [Pestalotiopsis sp. NC0098]|nr:F-box domain-containing protein [Pestalotiopsis sp. NC0098]
MQQEFSEASHRSQAITTLDSQNTIIQHGFPQLEHAGSDHGQLQQHSRSSSPPSSVRRRSTEGNVDIDQLDDNLSALEMRDSPLDPGRRITAYENALSSSAAASAPRQAMGFKVVKRANPSTDGPQLVDFPNEILTHIFSHLHPDSHTSVALVSKRFHGLITSSHAWRMAFQRYFPGHDALLLPTKPHDPLDEEDSEFIRNEVRFFTRLTCDASWRSEYLLRTRLLRSLARGKPSSSRGIGSSTRNAHTGKKLSAVLTYNTKLRSKVTHVHATFASSAKKPPRVVHGGADLNGCSNGDPTIGRVGKWGLDDPWVFAQYDQVWPNIRPYGLGAGGPVVLPNVMDVSEPFGVVGGEGFPGGRVFFRPTGVYRGKYINPDSSAADACPDIPKIPELCEGVSSLWVAKSSAVPALTRTMIGVLTGSTLGVLTAYAVGHDPTGFRFPTGQITARWVLSPGVPIVAIQVDEHYNPKRKAAKRVFAVALNALGEVFYLTEPPVPLATRSKNEDATKSAWYAGRSTYWHLLESTRRQAWDQEGENAVRGSYSPRSPCDAMDLTKDQLIAEAREIETFMRYMPTDIRKVCRGWDMRRRLEVDFSAVDEDGAGEAVFVIDRGCNADELLPPPKITRFSRVITSGRSQQDSIPEPDSQAETVAAPSLFGGGVVEPVTLNASKSQPPVASGTQSPVNCKPHDWRETELLLPNGAAIITTSAVDMSFFATSTWSEDASKYDLDSPQGSSTPAKHPWSEIPGRRARMIGVGTNLGSVWLWDMRADHLTDGIKPVRIIQTESTEISCLAISALYLVHGASDGLVQVWDPLASTLDPIRTVNSRPVNRVPRHIQAQRPRYMTKFGAVGAIYLDPDPTVLRGIVSYGSFVRYWAYSSTGQSAGKKRRLRHTSDMHVPSEVRRTNGTGGLRNWIAAETDAIRHEELRKHQEKERLRLRFGVGLADLTEEEQLQYAEMISNEEHSQDGYRRVSEAGSMFDTTSTSGRSFDTVTPDPSVAGLSPPAASSSHMPPQATDVESDFELQMQQALRLSLLEDSNGVDQPPMVDTSDDYDIPVSYTIKHAKTNTSRTPSSSHTPIGQPGAAPPFEETPEDMDDDLRLALELSLAEEEQRRRPPQQYPGMSEEEFPSLVSSGKGKGKAW